ncbi:hypothetical protein BJY01DRAFT_223948 [Aspergillus pseudoustus]|uniref:Cellobiose dehydrogenase-like cytochrome domain-containing protein n=1 Tax=Aspergillus pseudoustus TaxID=1810923 RepID=A0ABR4J6W7_9EURO
MTNSLLLVAYATADPPPPTSDSANSVAISPRYTSTYRPPGPYTGNATITPLSTRVSKDTDTFEVIFTCDSCLHWSQEGSEGGAKTSSGMIDLAWAVSSKRPVLADDGHGLVSIAQHARQGTWVAEV